MSIKSCFIIGSAFLSSLAFGQGAVLGTVGNVQGLVTDTDGASVSSTVPGEAIRDGETFVTSSSGSVTLQLNNGCTMTLQPNQTVTIDSRMTCRELTAAIKPAGAAVVAGGTGTAGGGGGSAAMGLLGVAGLAGAFFIVKETVLDKNAALSGGQ